VNLGACFTDAERKTKVEVALVHLKKEAVQVNFSFDGMSHDAREQAFDCSNLEGQIATRNLIGNMVTEFDKCRAIFRDLARLAGELAYYSRHIQGSYEDEMKKVLGKSLEPLFEGTPTAESVAAASTKFTRHLKRGAWHKVFKLTKFSNLMSQGMQADFEKFCRENDSLTFSEENILNLLDGLFASRGDIMRRCIDEAFDMLTKYHKENRMKVEGWKTNDAWRVNRRAVLPYCVNAEWGNPRINYGRHAHELNDLDRAMAFLEGKSLEQITTVFDVFNRMGQQFGKDALGALYESTYFEFRGYKKGTLHLHFKDKSLWERFNIEAARGKNWLPDDYKARENEYRARNKFADQCGLPVAV